MTALIREAQAKWRRDAALAPRARAAKAATYASSVALAGLYLRRATEVGRGVRVVGRPRISNHGRLVLGDGCVLRSTVVSVELVVASGAVLTLGPDVVVNSGSSIAATRSIAVGARVLIGPQVIINDSSYHDVYDRSLVPEPAPVVIEDDVWIGARATVLPGLRIGRGAIVMGHALVTRDVAAFSIVSGVPATLVGKLDPRKFSIEGVPLT